MGIDTYTPAQLAAYLRNQELLGIRRLQVSGFTQLDGGLVVNGDLQVSGRVVVKGSPAPLPNQSFFGYDASGTSSAATQPAPVMVGLADATHLNPPALITPLITGRVRVTMTFDVSNNTSGSSSFWELRYGAVPAPARLAAATGTNTTGQRLVGFTSGTFTYGTSIDWEAKNLSLGVTYWFDIAFGSNNGGTTTITHITVDLVEVS